MKDFIRHSRRIYDYQKRLKATKDCSKEEKPWIRSENSAPRIVKNGTRALFLFSLNKSPPDMKYCSCPNELNLHERVLCGGRPLNHAIKIVCTQTIRKQGVRSLREQRTQAKGASFRHLELRGRSKPRVPAHEATRMSSQKRVKKIREIAKRKTHHGFGLK
ncbi:hypothetical protein CEXT_777441 [Caerostris extrusa]|uniref:Uncharacterized protein n=1 Tax=Caerostris extrusa TaxID=172846 RepID=A0AAV4PXB0_CAEEX|nr:hypothetical protein CEXT_777441 [Caerostris extrusa]